jgi:hypothetical protein
MPNAAHNDAAALELQDILREDHGQTVTLQEAKKIGQTLISYFDLLAEIANENDYEKPNQRP